MLSQGPCVVRCQHHPAGPEKHGGRKHGPQKQLPRPAAPQNHALVPAALRQKPHRICQSDSLPLLKFGPVWTINGLITWASFAVVHLKKLLEKLSCMLKREGKLGSGKTTRQNFLKKLLFNGTLFFLSVSRIIHTYKIHPFQFRKSVLVITPHLSQLLSPKT